MAAPNCFIQEMVLRLGILIVRYIEINVYAESSFPMCNDTLLPSIEIDKDFRGTHAAQIQALKVLHRTSKEFFTLSLL